MAFDWGSLIIGLVTGGIGTALVQHYLLKREITIRKVIPERIDFYKELLPKLKLVAGFLNMGRGDFADAAAPLTDDVLGAFWNNINSIRNMAHERTTLFHNEQIQTDLNSILKIADATFLHIGFIGPPRDYSQLGAYIDEHLDFLNTRVERIQQQITNELRQ